MANIGNFDASTVDPTKPIDLLPPGKYVVQIVASEMRVTKDGMGQYLWLELDVLEGECAGRKLFDRLNLVNNTPSTVEFAQRTLSAISLLFISPLRASAVNLPLSYSVATLDPPHRPRIPLH